MKEREKKKKEKRKKRLIHFIQLPRKVKDKQRIIYATVERKKSNFLHK
jgi:hypothetical protein